MGNLTSPKFPEDENPGDGVLHPDGLILGGLNQVATVASPKFLNDSDPADWMDAERLAQIPAAQPGVGFYTGLTPFDPNAPSAGFLKPEAQAASAGAAPAQPGGEEVGEYYLPGLGPTYLNPQFADKVADFILRAQSHGIPLQFSSGYRDPAKQAALRNDPSAITPAADSLHSAGRGGDIEGWDALEPAQQATVVSDAAAAGLSWGGMFKKPRPDPVHFYSDPDIDRRQLIDRFGQSVTAFRNRIPDR